MKINIVFSIIAIIALAGCTTTDTRGFTKDQRAAAVLSDQKQREAWTLFGITIASKVVDAGISAYSNGGNERKLPRTFEK